MMGEVVDRRGNESGVMDDLHRSMIHECEGGSENFMASHDFIDGTFESGNVERASEAETDGDVPGRIAWFETIEIPESLLRAGSGETELGFAQESRRFLSRSGDRSKVAGGIVAQIHD